MHNLLVIGFILTLAVLAVLGVLFVLVLDRGPKEPPQEPFDLRWMGRGEGGH